MKKYIKYKSKCNLVKKIGNSSITYLGKPVIILGEYNIERNIYPEFHNKLNKIKIIFTNGEKETSHELKIKGNITINFP